MNFIANCSSLSNITLSGNLYNFHILFLNNCTNLSADVSSVIATKYAILDNLLQTTRITFFSATNSNFVIKFTIKYIHDLSDTLFVISFLTGTFIQFLILWYISHSPIYFSTCFVTPSYQLFLVTNSVIFHLPSYSTTSTS